MIISAKIVLRQYGGFIIQATDELGNILNLPWGEAAKLVQVDPSAKAALRNIVVIAGAKCRSHHYYGEYITPTATVDVYLRWLDGRQSHEIFQLFLWDAVPMTDKPKLMPANFVTDRVITDAANFVRGRHPELDVEYTRAHLSWWFKSQLDGDTYKQFKTTIEAIDAQYSSQSTKLNTMSRKLPGVYERTTYPCDCYPDDFTSVTRTIIMHMNDKHEWPREHIADWLDNLADEGEIDIDFH